MNHMLSKSLLGLASLGLTISATNAAIVGIDSVTLGTSNELLTATVGGTAFGGGVIADVAQDDYLITSGLSAPTTGGALINGDTTVFTPWDNDVLTGAGGGQSNPQTNGVLQLFWGGASGFTDNDADPDFFVFEDLGNDSVVVRAILANDTYGESISLSGWNSVSTSGVLNGTLTGRTVSGVAFDFTDLKDASGANLTNGTTIKGIWIGDQNDADFYEVYGNFSAVPESAAALLLGSVGLLVLLRRRR